MDAYSLILNQHKELIKKNTYARELEKKYHKTHHQRLKPSHKLTKPNIEMHQSLWPIESKAFTDVLRVKLSESTDQRFSKGPISNRLIEITSKHIKQLSTGNDELPKVNPNRFWSPPKPGDINSLMFYLNPGKFSGPKTRQMRYSIKNLG